jgi:hypothetical protein
MDEASRAIPEETGDPQYAELIERTTSRLVTSLVIAASIIGLAIYSRPGPLAYDAVATSDGRVVRVNRSNGSIVSCDARSCVLVYQSGGDLERATAPARPAVPAPTPTLSAPPPAAQPEIQAQTAPAQQTAPPTTTPAQQR